MERESIPAGMETDPMKRKGNAAAEEPAAGAFNR